MTAAWPDRAVQGGGGGGHRSPPPLPATSAAAACLDQCRAPRVVACPTSPAHRRAASLGALPGADRGGGAVVVARLGGAGGALLGARRPVPSIPPAAACKAAAPRPIAPTARRRHRASPYGPP